jgi:hypothetical protein
MDWLKAHGAIQQPAPELSKVVDQQSVQRHPTAGAVPLRLAV